MRNRSTPLAGLLLLAGVLAVSASFGDNKAPPPAESIQRPQSCANNQDDDGDFLVDCEEMDCWAAAHCQPPRCDAPDLCQLAACDDAPLCAESNCQDNADNDQDGLLDCFDPDCDSLTKCQIELCSNQEDDDLNGATDCEDPQCDGRSGCVFSPCRGSCLGSERCEDARDNDQDGLFDCKDPDCFGRRACGGLRALGEACLVPSQCGSNDCATEESTGYPDGSCTQRCDDASPCPASSLCVSGLCSPVCQNTEDCRVGYSCFALQGGKACLPDCGGHYDCPDTGRCNFYSGYCLPERGEKRDRALCENDTDCESLRCGEDGFCVSYCSTLRASCPVGDTCEGGETDAGICVDDLQLEGFVAPWEQPALYLELRARQRLSWVSPKEYFPTDEASVLFDRRRLHQIEIKVDPKERGLLKLREKTWARASFSFDGEPLSEIGVRLKGGDGSGQELPKKAGFSLKFDAFVNGGSFYGVKKLLLNNANQDPSYLSEPMAYWLYQRFGLEAPRTAFAEVTLDGESFGLYVIVEAKDERFLQKRFSAPGPLYEGAYGADLSTPDSLEEHIPGGLEDLTKLAELLVNTPDDLLFSQLCEWINLDQLFLVWALDAVFDNWDGYFFQANNYYLYQSTSGQFLFVPHGADQFFGTRDTRLDAYPLGALGRRLARSQLAKERFLKEARRLIMDPYLEDELRAEVDLLLSVIDGAARRDPKRTFTEEERHRFAYWVREFVALRREFLEASGVFR